MAAGIVYLDADDEITSAAARIRASTSPRVALIVPYGSRIATSRMNFRLLSREAVVSNRRLSIVAGDAATRALAASAGLPVFGSVAEYEAAGGPAAEGAAARPTDVAGDAAVAAARVAAASEAPHTPPVTPADSASTEDAIDVRPTASTLAQSETVAAVGPSDADAVTADTIWMNVPIESAPPREPRPEPRATRRRERPRPAPRPIAPPPVAREVDEPDEDLPADRRRLGGPLIAALAVAALAVIVVAAGAYLFLPAATIAVTPRRETISVDLTVSADPDATAVDASTGVVPAVRMDVPVQATQTFATVGKRVEAAPARGQVTFENYNPVSSNTIPSGSIVATEGGIRFRTVARVTVPAGTFVLPSVIPSRRSVQVEAVKDGPEGNVPANAIRVVPQGENPNFLKVNNPAPTDGGIRTETPEIGKDEVDKAVATLTAQLRTSFDDAVAAGAGAPAGTTLFPDTAQLGAATPDVDPQTLVGQQVPTFDLALTATGTVIAVDPSPVRSIAESRLKEKIGADYLLVEGSTEVDVGDGTVGGDGQVTFRATATALRVAILDPNQLRSLVKGKTVDEAEAALARYGDVSVDLWPSWVSTVTGVDARLSVSIEDVTSGTPTPSARPTATPSPRPTPTLGAGSPRPDGGGAEPSAAEAGSSGAGGSAAP